VVSLVEPVRYGAEETLVVVRGTAPIAGAQARDFARTVSALGDAHVVTANVARALEMTEADVRDETDVSGVDRTAAVRVRGEASSPAEAIRFVQEYGTVLTELVRARFAPLSLAPFDPAHASGGQTSPRWGRNLLAGSVAGALVAFGAALLLRRRGPASLLWPAIRTAKRSTPVNEPGRKPAPGAEAAPAPGPRPEPAPEPASAPAAVPRPGAWPLSELRRRVEAARASQPERVVEWDTYLDLLAEQEVNGVLPPGLDALIDDVFGSLLY
jgi:hypothetical protein